MILYLLLNGEYTKLYSQVTRIQGMGNLFLVIDDEDNELNLSDVGKNTAFLINDESKDWLKVRFITVSENGKLHRLFDPNGVNIYSVNFEALKIIDENQTFRGGISYTNYRKKDTYRAIQTDPYNGSFFMLFDTTTGSINFNGPAINFEYSANLFKDLTIGAKVDYSAQTGVKNIYSKPEITNRYISGQIAFAYAITDNLYVATKLDPFFNFERIELVTDADTGTDPTTYRYRGYNIFREAAFKFTRYNKNYGYNVDIQSTFRSKDSLINIYYSGGYQFQNLSCEDGTAEKDYEGYWQQDGFNINFLGRMMPEFISKDLTFGISISWTKMKSWAKHPQLPILFDENENTRASLGVGLSYYFRDIGLRCGFELHKTFIDTTLKDYISDEFFSENYPNNEFHFGLEYNFNENLAIRAGFIYTQAEFNHTPISTIINSPEVRFHKNNFTFGLNYLIPDFVRIDLLGSYGLKTSSGLPSKLKYDDTNIILFAKFFVF
jgi:hypothetical protein